MASKFNFNIYPYPTDPKFNEKIFKKKEFYINKTKKVDGTKKIETLMEEKCTGFRLSENQKFLKTFMSTETPYNGILLFHGTGVGKTCSSISIAEQYTDVLEKYNKKVFILLNPSIEENFKKNIFNHNTLKTKKVKAQCLGDTYLKKIRTYKNVDFEMEDFSKSDLEKISKKIDNRIKSQYRFQGYQEFSNRLTRLKEKLSARPGAYEKRIRAFFSNSVLIIDEAHNIKNTTEGKKIPKILEEVLDNTTEMKLILLTATPMFNEPQEIIFLLNLLLKNDKRELINTKDIFKADGSLTARGANILAEKSTGIVSYLRGENPLAFPRRLYPKHEKAELIKKFPRENFKGEEIPEHLRLQHLKLVNCVIEKGTPQREIYESVLKDGFGSFEGEGINISNIVFPGEYSNYQKKISREGFFNNFKKEVKGGKVHITPLSPEAAKMLDINEIGKYSTKMKKILDLVCNTQTKGIVFIYSRYVWAGVVMMALLLEMQGFQNKKGNLLNVDIGQGKRGDKAKYIIISGEQDLSSNSYLDYIKKESKNKNGERVKVILGSASASEGLDFKYIREVHVLDPWHHLNKIEQVIGRGIRYCSHIELKKIEDRNVTVYMYAATLSKDPSKQRETADLKIYRDAENKDVNMAKVTYLLKRNSVDCNLNLYSNKFTDDYFKDSKIDMVDSKGITRENLNFSDQDGDKRLCNYEKCDYTCASDLKQDLSDDEIDTDTFDLTVVTENINQVVDLIKELFRQNSVLTLEDMCNYDKIKKMNVDKDFIQLCINFMIKNKLHVKDKFKNTGVVLSKGKYYIFVPKGLKSDKISLREITRPLEAVKTAIDLTGDLKTLQKERVNFVKLRRQEIKKEDLIQLLDNEDLPDNKLFYMPSNIKELLLMYLIKNGLKKMKTQKDELYEKYYSDNKLNLKFNILYRDDTVDFLERTKTGKIYGYFVIEDKKLKIMEYNEETGKFSSAKNEDKKAVINYLRRTIQEDVSDKVANVVGYLENKENIPIMKIKNTSGEEGKSKKRKTTGIVLTSQGITEAALKEYVRLLLSAQQFQQYMEKKEKMEILENKDLKWFLKKPLFKHIKEQFSNKKERSDLYVILEDLIIENETKQTNKKRWLITLEENHILDLIKKGK